VKFNIDNVRFRNYVVYNDSIFEEESELQTYILTRYNIKKTDGSWTSIVFRNDIPKELR
jgi:hypothetical protein